MPEGHLANPGTSPNHQSIFCFPVSLSLSLSHSFSHKKIKGSFGRWTSWSSFWCLGFQNKRYHSDSRFNEGLGLVVAGFIRFSICSLVAYSFVPFSTISIVPQWLCCIVSQGFFLTPDEVLGLVTLHAHSVKPPAAWEDGRSSRGLNRHRWRLLNDYF